MSSSERRKFLILGAGLAVSACGFAPVYEPGSAALASRGALAIDTDGGLLGFAMRERLSLRLGDASAPSHSLQVRLKIESKGLAIATDADITRVNLIGTASYSIRRKGETEMLVEGLVQSFTAYDTTASPYATRVAERDARVRLAETLAELIAARVSASADLWLP